MNDIKTGAAQIARPNQRPELAALDDATLRTALTRMHLIRKFEEADELIDAAVENASSAPCASAGVNARSSTSYCASAANRSTAARVIPCRMSLPSARVMMRFPFTI